MQKIACYTKFSPLCACAECARPANEVNTFKCRFMILCRLLLNQWALHKSPLLKRFHNKVDPWPYLIQPSCKAVKRYDTIKQLFSDMMHCSLISFQTVLFKIIAIHIELYWFLKFRFIAQCNKILYIPVQVHIKLKKAIIWYIYKKINC